MWKKLKEWAWVIILALIGMLALGQKPRWVKEKEKEIKGRDKGIEQAKEGAVDFLEDYERVKADHDEEISKIKDEQKERTPIPEKPDPITNIDDAVDYVDDLIDRLRKRK